MMEPRKQSKVLTQQNVKGAPEVKDAGEAEPAEEEGPDLPNHLWCGGVGVRGGRVCVLLLMSHVA